MSLNLNLNDDDQNEDDQIENSTEQPTEETTGKEKTVENNDQESEEEEDGDIDEILNPDEAIQETPHDEYDWTADNSNISRYSKNEVEDYLARYDKTFSSLQSNEVVKAKVSSISDSGDVLLDVNYKSDGLISLSEFRDTPDLAVGDEIDVYVETPEDDRGQLVLSRRKAKLLRAWDNLVDSYENGTIIKGTVVSKTKGGLIVDAGGLETFLPGSQIDIKPIIDYDSYVGQTMEFKVVKINEAIKNAVVSHKALIESDLAEQREHIIAGLEKGQVLEGVVKNITDFGAFMDLGGLDGLLYITDISWGRINHPNEILELNQKVNVVVLDFDENKKRISLGMKQLQPHPWEVLSADIVAGSIVKGRIVNIEDYGAFLEIMPGVEGLIHVSEVTWSNQPVNAREYFSLGQEYEAKVVTIDKEDRKMSLSIKQLSNDPWNQVPVEFPVGSRHAGLVKNLTPYGVFVELKEGIGGMVHISDLSWTKRYSHPSEYTKVGENIDIQILDIDQDSRKLSLGHKQLEENPWDTFESVFPVGSYHEATVVKKDDRGGIVQMPYGLEAFAPIRHLRKEDGSTANIDDSLTFKVIEFNRDDKRILVSHSRYLEDIQKEADHNVREEKVKERKTVQRNIEKQAQNVERTTLGDMAAFSQLKEQLAANSDTPAPAAPEPVEAKVAGSDTDVTNEKVSLVELDVESTDQPEIKKEIEVVEVSVEEVKAPEVKVEEVKIVEVKAEEPKKEVPAAKTTTSAASSNEPKDDLRKIEGIGPKIAGLLNDKGILTFKNLSETDPNVIKEILAEAGPRYQLHNPTTWPQQAGLAADGKWEELKELQDRLDGGV